MRAPQREAPALEAVADLGVAAKLLPGDRGLWREVVEEAAVRDHDGQALRVAAQEQLVAMAWSAPEARRLERAPAFVQSNKFDRERLAMLLRRHGFIPTEPQEPTESDTAERLRERVFEAERAGHQTQPAQPVKEGPAILLRLQREILPILRSCRPLEPPSDAATSCRTARSLRVERVIG